MSTARDGDLWKADYARSWVCVELAAGWKKQKLCDHDQYHQRSSSWLDLRGHSSTHPDSWVAEGEHCPILLDAKRHGNLWAAVNANACHCWHKVPFDLGLVRVVQGERHGRFEADDDTGCDWWYRQKDPSVVQTRRKEKGMH